MFKKKIARNIKYYRKINDYTQETLADTLNNTRSAISSWETGTNTPDIFTLIELTKLFNVSLSQLVGEQERDYYSSSFSEEDLAERQDNERLFLLHQKLELLSHADLELIEFAFDVIEQRKKNKKVSK